MTTHPVSADEHPDPSAIRWFHSFKMPDGTVFDGVKPLDIQLEEADLIFSGDLIGKSVLDIGAWDGFFSYEAERRGAGRVLATDHFCWSGPGWGNRDGFDFIHRARDSQVESLDIDVLDLSPEALGTFDVVLFLGVLYHVKDPYSCLEAAARMCSDHLIIETVTALPLEPLPAMRLYKPGELGGDPTNFWAPNLPALEVMLENFGFTSVEFLASPASPKHPLTRSRIATMRGSNGETHRTIIHARR
ncbi:methyltransferase domain-containing protein [Sphingomonas sp. UYEF23]|uniref:class I SAM-dependent methyltransferase n=1 Tax=Sphingomonas sp. UYEF23 TaxID=1756408 RepID=UPI003395CCA5